MTWLGGWSGDHVIQFIKIFHSILQVLIVASLVTYSELVIDTYLIRKISYSHISIQYEQHTTIYNIIINKYLRVILPPPINLLQSAIILYKHKFLIYIYLVPSRVVQQARREYPLAVILTTRSNSKLIKFVKWDGADFDWRRWQWGLSPHNPRTWLIYINNV